MVYEDENVPPHIAFDNTIFYLAQFPANIIYESSAITTSSNTTNTSESFVEQYIWFIYLLFGALSGLILFAMFKFISNKVKDSKNLMIENQFTINQDYLLLIYYLLMLLVMIN